MTPTPESKPSSIRRTVHFSGRVQGVFFRATTCTVATPLSVTGFVRNLPDGRVELVAEGTPTELDRLQGAVMNAMRSNITEVSSTDGPATGEFTSFRVAY